ncbi:putative bolA protein C4B3.11c [Phytophthora cinnamomi]|uniref:putative bolA protein C4B3.11c n=1 Tax=Phytophthora cinnamomi TaxID=4785 RepID=UPI00355A03DF|nr:putative bolA protein C4B3.11c [Phytophthora cinnamomi]
MDVYLGEYSRIIAVLFARVFEFVPTTRWPRNKKIREAGSTQPLVPDEWVHYGKIFVCTHAGRYKSRGQGKRKRQQSRALDCDVQSNACVQVVDASVPTFAVRFTTWHVFHNHALSEHTFRQYPHNRNALEAQIVDTVNTLQKAGAPKKQILQYIHENSVWNPTNQDVHNLVRRLKKQDHVAPTIAKR